MPEDAPLSNTNPSAGTKAQRDAPVTFERVFRDELIQIAESRRARGLPTEPNRHNLVGLAFSGGGIRSATFNLGILQALAENELLHKFDYLSTVSGGGYIGSWLAATTRRLLAALPNSSFDDVEKALIPVKRGPGGREERTFLRWLRLYSNYLTPHTGLLSGDTWAMVGTWLRNVFLNQTVLGLFFLSVFVSCHGVLLGLLRSARLHALELLIPGAVAWFMAAVFMAVNAAEQIPSQQMLLTPFQRVKVTVTVIVPFFLACLLLNIGLWRWKELAESPLWMWFAAGGGIYFSAWTVAAVSMRVWRVKRQKKGPGEEMLSLTAFLLSSLIAGAVGGGLGRGYLTLLLEVPKRCYSAYWMIAVVGTGAIMLIMLLSGALHLGLAGRGSRDLVREWWARLGGYLMLLTLSWVFLAGSCAFGPLLVRWVVFKLKWGSIVPAILWIAHNYLGVKAANSPETSGKVEKVKSAEAAAGSWFSQLFTAPKVLDAVARLAPYVFAMGLILLLATAVHIGAGLFFDRPGTLFLWHLSSNSAPPVVEPGSGWAGLANLYWKIQWSGSPPRLLAVGIALAIASLLLSRRVDVNDFSLHHFYRNRLVRCYLGASNPKRKPQPFTGFDPDDDLPLKDFAGNYPGPYPILNAALNITSGAELGYATRRAKSFVFTPLYCGYDLILPGEGENRFRLENAYELSYSKTAEGRTEASLTRMTCEGGIALGTAMAISGAAASPNMGYFTSPATGLFMTLFDVRLGWWMGNSRFSPKWQSAGPKWGLGYLFSELAAQSDQNKGYVYLSDGGHFENLAVYELIKRHCKLIVACDADCDGSYAFDNLLDLIEKARSDFGARIVIDFSKIRPRDGRESEHNFVIGDIFYDPQNDHDRGSLIYIKTSMPPREDKSAVNEHSLPDDVWRYYEKHQTFPHQSTADQWFDELQFEGYRALGEHLGNLAAKDIRDKIAEVA
ncbi:MAG: patatin-like phospholipase family protein [Terriglobales bacterium]